MSKQNTDNDLYELVPDIIMPYLRPSTERFIKRQMINQLDIALVAITESDIKELRDSLRLSMTISTDSERDVGEYVDKIAKLIGIVK